MGIQKGSRFANAQPISYKLQEDASCHLLNTLVSNSFSKHEDFFFLRSNLASQEDETCSLALLPLSLYVIAKCHMKQPAQLFGLAGDEGGKVGDRLLLFCTRQ